MPTARFHQDCSTTSAIRYHCENSRMGDRRPSTEISSASDLRHSREMTLLCSPNVAGTTCNQVRIGGAQEPFLPAGKKSHPTLQKHGAGAAPSFRDRMARFMLS